MGKYAKTAALIIAAVIIAWGGGMTRSYHAFGGEDVLALLIIAGAIRAHIEETKREKGRS